MGLISRVAALVGRTTQEFKQVYAQMPVSVRGFGAVGDGVTDDTAAFLAALKSNRTVLVPPTGSYYKVTGLMVLDNIEKLTINAAGARILNSDKTKATWLFANSTNVTVNDGYYGYSQTITGSGGNSQHVFQFEKCRDVTLDTIHVLNSPEMGVALTNCINATVCNSTIENTWRDGTYSHYSANVRYLNNTYRNIKDDAMSFHDYDDATQRTYIAGFGYSQATGLTVDSCTVQDCYQGFGSVAGRSITIKNCGFRNTVLAGIALMNQKVLSTDNVVRLTDAVLEGNYFYNCCSDTTIMDTLYPNGGQSSAGRASIFVGQLGDGNNISLTDGRRLSSIRIRGNYVFDCGALGMHCNSVDGLTLSANQFQNCKVDGTTLAGNVVEIWECTGYTEESVTTVIDTRTPVQHQRGYSFSGVYGTMNTWLVSGKAVADGMIANSPQIRKIGSTDVFAQLVSGTATRSGDGITTEFSIPHGLATTPGFVHAMARSDDADNTAIRKITASATHILISYKVAPPTGDANLTWTWMARV